MKPVFKTILKTYLRVLTKLILFVRRPVVIVVAGSTNKHFIKQEVKRVLGEKGYSVRANPKNFNTEIGLPLAVLNLPSGYNSYKRWLPAIKQAPLKIFERNFPRYLVLSLGSSDPGDMKYLLRLVKPQVAIISDITQRYMEGFKGLDGLLGEYSHLVKKLRPSHYLLLNADNERVLSLKNETKAKIINYGFGEKADCRVIDNSCDNYGQKIKISYEGQEHDFNLDRFGKHHIYSKLIGYIISSKVFK